MPIASTKEDEQMSRSAVFTFKAKEEDIEKKKLEVRKRVRPQLGRIEEETRRLLFVRIQDSYQPPRSKHRFI